ncbi:MAG: CCA tRNA nucleotidyltransferase [Pirellulales bacterium]|nr:CCA tRNA nucleotidyltransferase [Pirellulales bacterium]
MLVLEHGATDGRGFLMDDSPQRRFAEEVVRKLRAAGFEAYWAGGCVRDQLLGRTPKDYDVATNALPEQIRNLFGHRRTLALGAAFGVITVKGPKGTGMIEVATFRKDDVYSDGRHPDRVTFSSAEEDARRRDFTINGLFYDPLEARVIDFVGGQEDLEKRRIRAIGDPRERIAEDKLRMLRAVRFTAAFDFTLDSGTSAAIRELAPEIHAVSPERIAMEMRRILTEPGHIRAVELLLETGLAAEILPEIVPQTPDEQKRFEINCGILHRMQNPGFPLAFAALLHGLVPAEQVKAIGRRWRLSNEEIERSAWLAAHHAALCDPANMKWSQLQPYLISDGVADLLALMEATSPESATAVAYCREKLRLPPNQLNPPPLITGDDLLQLGIPQGPIYRELLEDIRRKQLDQILHSRKETLHYVKKESRHKERMRHQELKHLYGSLYDQVAAVLFTSDPIGINFEHNTDEYEPETSTILPQLPDCRSEEDVQRLLHREFVKWFDEEIAGPPEIYVQPAKLIWDLWRKETKGTEFL